MNAKKAKLKKMSQGKNKDSGGRCIYCGYKNGHASSCEFSPVFICPWSEKFGKFGRTHG